ncbi:uncharacterized protein LOC105172474 [Sesamum indicum]|uniref:Uncharacterized protein LOC105172474 n=1 Tax=Sesamum indicum TaxID=4182 RepID=A0A6I9U3S3_SESIN|nr:uncharacterized protein LOC105172474 [Sesamum indicum]
MAANYTNSMAPAYNMFRNETTPGYTELEKRQLFLRSYQFSRKQSAGERIRKSLFRVKKAICVRLRSVRKLRKMLWFNLRNGFFLTTRRRRFFRRLNHHHSNYFCPSSSRGISSHSSCFW